MKNYRGNQHGLEANAKDAGDCTGPWVSVITHVAGVEVWKIVNESHWQCFQKTPRVRASASSWWIFGLNITGIAEGHTRKSALFPIRSACSGTLLVKSYLLKQPHNLWLPYSTAFLADLTRVGQPFQTCSYFTAVFSPCTDCLFFAGPLCAPHHWAFAKSYYG